MGKRVLVCEFHQESNTFNPVLSSFPRFGGEDLPQGRAAYARCKEAPLVACGLIEGVEESGGEVIFPVSLLAGSGGRVADEVYERFRILVRKCVAEEGPFDGAAIGLHGATCTESLDDPCGAFLAELRGLLGPEVPIAAAFDLHANITDRMLRAADIICGYQCYPHIDLSRTGYRAASLLMRRLAGEPCYMAAAAVPMLTPPSGYTTASGPFKAVADLGHSFVESGVLLDYTVFNVQPWLDIPDLQSRVVTIARDPENALAKADQLAAEMWNLRDVLWPDLQSIDEAIDHAEDPASRKPVLLVDASDSPNGGAAGDSVAVALRLLDRGSRLRAGMFVADPEAVGRAFSLGVGAAAEFTLGASMTPGLPGPLRAEARVVSLHDGIMPREARQGRGSSVHIGRTAVLRIANMDIMICEKPAASGDPQILRHFGIEPTLLDLVVVKANTSFLEPYSAFAGDIIYADTPGACSANLRAMPFTRLPKPLYPFDEDPDLGPGKAILI